MRHIVAGLALSATLLLAGCLPESEQPIAAPDPAKTDARLWGSWLSEAEDGYSIAHIFALEGGKLEIVFAEHDVEGVGKAETYEAHSTRLPNGDYLNVVVTEPGESGYVVGKYEFSGTNQISIAFASNEALEQAVKDGALPGTITPETGGNDLHITATPEQWQAFLAKAPTGLFGDMSAFTQVGPAYVEQQ